MPRQTRGPLSATRSADGAYCPDAGDIIWIDFNPQAGNEQAMRRPALVLSPAAYNGRLELCILCPITNQKKGYPFESEVPAACTTTGVVLSDHVKSLSWSARRSKFIEKAPAALVDDVKAKIATLLGF